MVCHRKIIVLWSGINHECLAAGKMLIFPFPVCLRQKGVKITIKAVCTKGGVYKNNNNHQNKITLYKAVLKYVVLPPANCLFPFPVAIAPPAKSVQKMKQNVLPQMFCRQEAVATEINVFPLISRKMVMFCHRKIVK